MAFQDWEALNESLNHLLIIVYCSGSAVFFSTNCVGGATTGKLTGNTVSLC